MDALVGTILLVVFCLVYFDKPMPPENFKTNEVIQIVEIKIRTNEGCKNRINRLYASYDLESPTEKTLIMLCGDKEN